MSSKREEVQNELEMLRTRVVHLEESRRRLNIFDGLNDGNALTDTNKRLSKAKYSLSTFIENNLEYVI